MATVTRPADAASLQAVLEAAPPRGVVARGLGRSYGDAAQNAGGAVLSTTALDAVRRLDVEADLVTVEAGASLASLSRLLVPRGRFLPVVPGTGHVTVGGAIASDVHGKSHHRDGGFAAHLASIDLLTPDGERRRVSRDEDPDLFAATAGGMGLTGVILAATLRLLRIETDRMVVDTERASDLDDVMSRMESGDDRYRYSVAWIDCLARGNRLGRSVLFRGDHATADQLGPQASAAPVLAAPADDAIGAPP
ncbi:MAG: FAD-binding oxidoreductase, partial [Thermoleophilaceae bacterium]|nr:FAD-binding oxidoreductase [Thermoleophilaceae bacterium]